jgi:hypothetical protein
MDLLFCENVIVKFLFTNVELRERSISYLVPEIFDDVENRNIIKVVRDFTDKFEKFPSVNEMKLELSDETSYKKLLDNLNINID